MNPTVGRTGDARIWGVGALLQAAADALGARIGTVRVGGEISALVEASSGHRYFSLKDDRGQSAVMRCALFRRAQMAAGGLALRDGMKIEAVGRLTVYGPRGDLQFVVDSVHPIGAGSLHEEFLRLKARLSAEGLFDTARKRTLPSYPRRIGVICSLNAAALRDVLTVVARRAPHVEVIVYPSLVQGIDAPPELVSALQRAARRAEVEALILTRGGGSLEDLWAFNDERVVRAVAASPIPVVCGVGHETDVTLADFAADLRAATPTAAAELLTPVQQAQEQGLDAYRQRLSRAAGRVLDGQAQRLDQMALMVSRPARSIAVHQQAVQRLQGRLQRALVDPISRATQGLERRAARLMAAQRQQSQAATARWQQLSVRIDAQDPRRVLRRGYAWVCSASGVPLTSAESVAPGDAITAVWQDGHARAVVTEVAPAEGQAP